MTQLPLAGSPSPPLRCSPSRLLAWLECPRRYRLTYLTRPRPPTRAWAHQSVGAAIHEALRDWWWLPRLERTPPAAAQRLGVTWRTEGFRDPAQAAAWLAHSRRVLARYVSTLDPDDEPLGVERTVSHYTPAINFSGRVDRLDQRGDQLAIVDYKTGRRPPTEEDVRGSLALALYAIGARRVFRRPCRRVELHHLPTLTVVGVEHSDDSLDRHLRRAEDLAIEAQRAQRRLADGAGSDEIDRIFPARPGPGCGWCDVAGLCPEGQRAAPAQPAWAGLDPAVA